MLHRQEAPIASINYRVWPWLPRVHANVAGVIRLNRLHREKLLAARAVQARPEHYHTDSVHTVSMQIVHLILRCKVVILFCRLQLESIRNNCQAKHKFFFIAQPRRQTMQEHLPRLNGTLQRHGIDVVNVCG